MPREITFAEAVREATHQIMESDKSVVLIGEGVPDPKCVFGTTKDLQEDFPGRVFDMPISENALTGACVGMAITGLRPIIVHQRIDFLLYAMDQVVNNAAKWYSMFGSNAGNCPMIIRCIVGRGWGQGNQHSQNLSGLFATIPGLTVVTPSNARDAKGMLIAASKEKGPVLFVEHRWLHNTTSDVPEQMYETEIGKSKKLFYRNADFFPHLTVVAWSYMVSEVLKAVAPFGKKGINVDVIDMGTLRPMDLTAVKDSVRQSKRLLVVDDSWKFNGLAGEIIAAIAEDHTIKLNYTPKRIALPDGYAPSSPWSAPKYYPRRAILVKTMLRMLNRWEDSFDDLLKDAKDYDSERPHDVPDQSFRGPF